VPALRQYPLSLTDGDAAVDRNRVQVIGLSAGPPNRESVHLLCGAKTEVDARIAGIRSQVPAEHQAEFDEQKRKVLNGN
jgi:replicative superfamily II helicase